MKGDTVLPSAMVAATCHEGTAARELAVCPPMNTACDMMAAIQAAAATQTLVIADDLESVVAREPLAESAEARAARPSRTLERYDADLTLVVALQAQP